MMNESRPQPVLFRFHVKPAPAPGERRHTVHVSPEAHIVAIRFAGYLQRAALGPPRPKPMHLPRSSTAAGHLPPHRARPTQRKTATGHRESASGWSSRATAYALPASEKGEAITSQPAAWNHVLRLGDVCRRLTKHCRRTLHHWFHVKPTHEHGVGVMADRRRHTRGPLSQDR